MTITVLVNGETPAPISGVIWTSKSKWVMQPNYVHQTIPYGAKGKIYKRGADNATCTLNGRILKGNDSNETIMYTLVASSLLVSTDYEQVRGCTVTSLSVTERGQWWFITASLVEE